MFLFNEDSWSRKAGLDLVKPPHFIYEETDIQQRKWAAHITPQGKDSPISMRIPLGTVPGCSLELYNPRQ